MMILMFVLNRYRAESEWDIRYLHKPPEPITVRTQQNKVSSREIIKLRAFSVDFIYWLVFWRDFGTLSIESRAINLANKFESILIADKRQIVIGFKSNNIDTQEPIQVKLCKFYNSISEQ